MRKRVEDQVADRRAKRERLAEVEAEGSRQVGDELVEERAVHPEVAAEGRDRIGRGGRPEERDRRVPGEDPHHDEHQHQRSEHGRHDLDDPSREMAHPPRYLARASRPTRRRGITRPG